MFSIEEALETPIWRLKGWRLDLKCRACGTHSELFLIYFVKPGRDPILLRDLLMRLRCKVCRQRPSGAMLALGRLGSGGRLFSDIETEDGVVQLVLWDDDR